MTGERDDAEPRAGGFHWGLTPSGEAEPPALVEPAPAPPAPTLPVYEPAPAPPPAAPVDPAIEGVTEVLHPHQLGLPDPVDESAESTAIDSLFGDAAFVEYAPQPLIPTPAPRSSEPVARGAELVVVPVATPKPKPQRAPLPPLQKTLMWVAGGLVAVLALIGLFVLGLRIAGSAPSPVAAPAPSASPTASAEPVEAPVAIGPVAPGSYQWNELLGGECLEPFESAWQDRYTVVDCAAPHAAQLLARGTFDDAAGTEYPGMEALQQRTATLCTAPTVVDYATAGAVADVQVSASYAADAQQWADGDRDYFCFADRAGGEPLTASIALPQAAPAP